MNRLSSSRLVLVAAASCLSLSAGAGTKPAPKTHTVLIKGFKFDPEKLTVAVGDTVVWKNKDIVPHTATCGQFNSKGIESGKSWSYKVGKKGSFAYICEYHPTMKATLIVK